MRKTHPADVAVRTLRDGRVEAGSALVQASTSNTACETLQGNARLAEHATAGASAIESRELIDGVPSPLTARQLSAINFLMLGKSVVATAASIKVDPSTIHRWKSSNPHFIAELNRRQHDAFDQIVTKLRITMGAAVDALYELVHKEYATGHDQTVWKLIGYLKPQKLITPTGPTTARDVIDEKIRETRRQRGEIVEAPIEEEDRIAWIEAQSTSSATGVPPVKGNGEQASSSSGTGHRQVKKSKEEDAESDHERDARATGDSQAISKTPEDNGSSHHVPEARATVKERERDTHDTGHALQGHVARTTETTS